MSPAERVVMPRPAADESPGGSGTPTDRREAITRAIAERTGIDGAMIERLVHRFYAKVRDDSILGPVFAARIADWPAHLQRMCSFWSSVALVTGSYHGRPMEKHVNLPIDARHFDRWLALFEQTARDICPPAAAGHFIERAHNIAESLELGMASYRGLRLGKTERLRRPDAEVMLPKGSPR